MASATRTRRPGNRATAQENDEVTDVATAPETAATTNGTAAGTATEARVRKNAPVQLSVPPELKAMIKAKADEAGKTEPRWILENIASDLGYTLPETTRGSGATRPTALFPKSLTPEQKKQRFDAARALLQALDEGKLNLDDIKAQLSA